MEYSLYKFSLEANIEITNQCGILFLQTAVVHISSFLTEICLKKNNNKNNQESNSEMLTYSRIPLKHENV